MQTVKLSRFRIRRFSLVLSVLVGLASATTAPAQFTFVTNNGAITITGYTGPGGDVVIPSTTNGFPVTSIGTNAFYNCWSLTNVTISSGVTNIGIYAFENCSNLASVTIPDSVVSIGGYAFFDCYSLTSVTIPNGVASIGFGTFWNCQVLTNVTFPSSVTSIGSYAFYWCFGLTSLTIPNSVTNIGANAFFACTNLASMMVDTNNQSYCSVSGVLFNKSQTVLILYPARLSGGYIIPNSVTNIGDYAFYFCTSLTSVTIPNSVTSIGNDVFYACYSLTSVTIPNSVTSIGNYAFYFCTSLASVTIPNSVTNIGNYTFESCRLTSVIIPNSVIGVGVNAFAYCFSLTNLTIGSSVTSIGPQAFYYCQNLTSSVTIPSSVTNIGTYAFEYCDLFAVYFQGNAPPDNGTAFSGNIWATVYYLPGTKGWGAKFGSLSAVLWNPQAQTKDANFGVRTNRFGFNITGTKNIPIVVEASTNLANPVWIPITTNGLLNGTNYFSDPQWTNYPNRFYRIRSP